MQNREQHNAVPGVLINIERKIETLDKAETIIIPTAGLFLIIALIRLFLIITLYDNKSALAGTLIAAIVSASIIAVPVVLEKYFRSRRKNIAGSIKQHELNAFFAFEKACCT
jgi:hypothetical protein